MRASSINVDLRDEEIAKKLDETLRKPLEASEISEEVDLDVHDSPCFHFLCENDPNYLRVKQLVRSLSWELKERNIQAGVLLWLTVGEARQSTPYVLGVSLKKPAFHILVRGFLNDSELALTQGPNDLPHFQSSHELMLELLNQHSSNPDEIFIVGIQVWKCNAFISAEAGWMLKTNPETMLCEFTVSSRNQQSKRKPVFVKLPYGFGLRKKASAKKKSVKSTSRPSSKEVKAVKKTQLKKAKPETPKASSLASNKASSDGDSSSSTDSDAEEQGSSAEGCEGVEREEESVQPMSAVVASEQAEALRLARELEEDDATRALARELRNTAASGQGMQPSSFLPGKSELKIAIWLSVDVLYASTARPRSKSTLSAIATSTA